MVEKGNVSDILNKKILLIKGLEENIFKYFTSDEESLLHSKHGRIKVWHESGAGKIYDGITGAFKVGLPLTINCNPVKTIPKITIIDWDSYIFQTVKGDWYNFEFSPIKLREIINLV